MALTGAMSAGISGLKAHMEALNTVGNNVANVNTYGYKPGRVTFRESIYSTQAAGSAGTNMVGGTNPRQTGYGCSIGTIDLDMTTSSLESTGMPTDCFIQGGACRTGARRRATTAAASITTSIKSTAGHGQDVPWATPP